MDLQAQINLSPTDLFSLRAPASLQTMVSYKITQMSQMRLLLQKRLQKLLGAHNWMAGYKLQFSLQ
jgi:hypothetical protein